MKFDIVKFIDDACQDYLQGHHTKEFTLLEIKLALEENSWPMLCDGKEVADVSETGGTIETNDHVWTIHPDWCIEDKTEAEDNETYTDR